MNYNSLSVTLLVLGLFFGCTFSEKEKEANEFKILRVSDKEEPKYASELFQNMEIIKLETTSDCLIEQVIKIEFSNNKIFIQDNQNQGLYVFDSEGKFIRNINKKGRGPEEYSSFDDFIVDTKKSSLEILDRSAGKIYVYDLATESLLRTLEIPLTFVFKFFKNDNSYYFQTNGSRNNIDGKPTNSDVIAYDYKNQKIWPLIDRTIDDSQNQFLEFNNVFYANSKNQLFVSLSWDQVIYKLLNDSLKPFYDFDVGERAIPLNILEGTSDEKLAYVFSEEGQDKIGGFRLLSYEEGLSIIVYGKGASTKPNYYFLFDDGKNSFSSNQIINDLTPVAMPDIDMHSVSDNVVLSLMYPAEIKGSEFFNNYNLSENDNPILLKLKLK